VIAAFRTASKRPDAGGSDAAMRELIAARNYALSRAL
jgi:hypothetical protein